MHTLQTHLGDPSWLLKLVHDANQRRVRLDDAAPAALPGHGGGGGETSAGAHGEMENGGREDGEREKGEGKG